MTIMWFTGLGDNIERSSTQLHFNLYIIRKLNRQLFKHVMYSNKGVNFNFNLTLS